jgi:hypothetical protein
MHEALSLALSSLLVGCEVDQTKGTEAHCNVTELQHLMEGCVEYGGDYIGESRSVTTVDCSAKLSDIDDIIGFTGTCVLTTDSSCAIECDFPQGVGTEDSGGNG